MNVLIQCCDHLENQKRVMLLARKLFANNISPVILMYNPNKGSYIKSEGFKVVYLNDYLKKFENDSLKKMNLVVEPKKLLEAEAKRNLRLVWPSQYSKNLDKCANYIAALNSIIDDIKPFHICIWNGYTGFTANALRLMVQELNIDSSYIERGLFKDSLFIDKEGVNGASSLSNKKAGAWRYSRFSDELNSYCAKIFSLNEKSKDHSKETRVIFFPLQVQLDTNIIYYSPYKTMREALICIYERFNDGRTIFVVRPHPEEVEGLQLNFPIYENLIISAEKPLSYWIEAADVVVTINSTVGLEALIAGKQVVCIGESIYSGLNCVSRLKNDSLEQNDSKEIRDYLCFLLDSNLIKSDSDFSENVISKNIGCELSENKRKTKSEIAHPFIKEFLSGKEVISVSLNFSPGKRLDLTYRNNNSLIDISYIKNLLKDIFGNLEFSFEKSGLNKKTDISIVDDDWKGGDINSSVVIDYYGGFKYIKGLELL